MKILLAGATGAIGRPLVRRLTAAGHEVVGLSRSEGRARALDGPGVRGVAVDVRDRDAVLRLADEIEPDVVLDETTDLPQRYDARTLKGFYDGMGDLRTRGSTSLLEAAERTGARFGFQSIAFLYDPAHEPGRLRTEADPVYVGDAPPPWDVALGAIVELEERTAMAGGLVFRYGFFHGPGTHFAPGGETYESVVRRRFPIMGAGGGVWSFIHVDDAAAATVAALEREAKGIFNVVDDRPRTLREWLPEYAQALGAPKPLRIPAVVAKPFSAELTQHYSLTLAGASNARAKAELGWSPRYSTPPDGLRDAETREERTEYTA